MNEHLFGERRLDRFSPPHGATGLITREEIYKDREMPKGWLGKILNPKYKPRYFIFRVVRGTHDYRSNGEMICGGYEAHMGYWHYATEAERDDAYDELISKGYSDGCFISHSKVK